MGTRLVGGSVHSVTERANSAGCCAVDQVRAARHERWDVLAALARKRFNVLRLADQANRMRLITARRPTPQAAASASTSNRLHPAVGAHAADPAVPCRPRLPPAMPCHAMPTARAPGYVGRWLVRSGSP